MVFVVDCDKKPLMPCKPSRAKRLLKQGKAAVFRRYPFTIILKERTGGDTQPMALKFDPGSKVTGIAVVGDFEKQGSVVLWGAELKHRAKEISESLTKRRGVRRSRRNRKTRYRQPGNLKGQEARKHGKGWLPPSLRSRIDNITNWTKKLQRFCPITTVHAEIAQFDTQKMQNPEISGVEYQHGTLEGNEIRAYLLEKFEWRCAYCDKKVERFEIDHVVPRSLGGSNRVSNLVLSCHACNQKKGNKPLAEFLKRRKAKLALIEAQLETGLQDAAAMNASRYAILQALEGLGLPVLASDGARTAFNRRVQAHPKAHWIDAACVGEHGETVWIPEELKPLFITAKGRGSRKMTSVDKYGFPRSGAKQVKRLGGIFQTGDFARLVCPSGKYQGVWTGRIISVCANGRCEIKTPLGRACRQYREFELIQKVDGYLYQV